MNSGFRPLAVSMAVLVPAIAVASIEDLRVFSPGDPITADGMNANFSEVRSALEQLTRQVGLVAEKSAQSDHFIRGMLVTENQDVEVGNCEELSDALSSFDGVSIKRNALITLTVAPGTHDGCPVITGHKDGDRILVRGGGTDPSDTTLKFTADGLRLTATSARIENMTLVGALGSDPATGAVGIWVESGGRALARDLVVREFSVGILSEFGGHVSGTAVVATSNRDVGFYSRDGATMLLRSASAFDNGDYGFWAFRHGYIQVRSNADGEAAAYADGNGTDVGAALAGLIMRSRGSFENPMGAALAYSPSPGELSSDGAFIQ